MTSACLCVMYGADGTVLFATYPEASVRLAVIFTSAASQNEDIKNDTTSPELLGESLHEHLTVSFE